MINRMVRNGDAQVLSLRDAMDRLLEQSFTPFGRGFMGEGQQSVPSNLWEDSNMYKTRGHRQEQYTILQHLFISNIFRHDRLSSLKKNKGENHP